ncbi:hypothetical protein [Mycobacterium lepromatosis]|nr:hypothetical protein [Mycobacterium lepromatosis]
MLTKTSGSSQVALTNDFFVNLLDMRTKWSSAVGDDGKDANGNMNGREAA